MSQFDQPYIYSSAPSEAEVESAELVYSLPGAGTGQHLRTIMNGNAYSFFANDVNVNSSGRIMAAIDDGRLACEYWSYVYALHGSDTAPTPEQAAAVEATAWRLLDGICPDEWEISSCKAQPLYSSGRYLFRITARRLWDGYPVLFGSSDERPSCEEVSMRLGTDGTLLSFDYRNPCQELGYISQRENIISLEKAMELATAALMEKDKSSFDMTYETVDGPSSTASAPKSLWTGCALAMRKCPLTAVKTSINSYR